MDGSSWSAESAEPVNRLVALVREGEGWKTPLVAWPLVFGIWLLLSVTASAIIEADSWSEVVVALRSFTHRHRKYIEQQPLPSPALSLRPISIRAKWLTVYMQHIDKW